MTMTSEPLPNTRPGEPDFSCLCRRLTGECHLAHKIRYFLWQQEQGAHDGSGIYDPALHS